jgi:hypothetical protein
MQEFIYSAIIQPLQNLLEQVYQFLPYLFAMVLLLIVGFIVAYLIKKILYLILKLIKFDSLSYRLGFSKLLEKSGIRSKPSQVMAKFVYWFLLIVFIMLALNALNVKALDVLVSQFFLFLPNLVAGLILFFAGYLLSIFLERTVLIAAVNAGVQFAKFLSRGVQILVLLFFLAIALEQTGIGESIVTASFTIIFGGLVLALALALGLGGRELGKEWLEKQMGKKEAKDEEKNMWSHL